MLAFILSPIGKWIGVILGALIALSAIFGAGYGYGWSKRDKACDAAADRAKIEALERDRDNANAAAEEAKAHASELQTQSDQNQEVIRGLREAIAKRPAAQRCTATDDDARRLRNLR